MVGISRIAMNTIFRKPFDTTYMYSYVFMQLCVNIKYLGGLERQQISPKNDLCCSTWGVTLALLWCVHLCSYKYFLLLFSENFLCLFWEPEAPEGTAHEIFKMLISAHFHISETSVRSSCVTAKAKATTTTRLQQRLYATRGERWRRETTKIQKQNIFVQSKRKSFKLIIRKNETKRNTHTLAQTLTRSNTCTCNRHTHVGLSRIGGRQRGPPATNNSFSAYICGVASDTTFTYP